MKREDPDSATDVTLRIFVWLETRGERAYGEEVTQLQHAPQCAELAHAADAPPVWSSPHCCMTSGIR